MKTLTDTLRGIASPVELKPLEKASDIVLRKKELYGLIQSATFDRAFDRLNDFVVDFSRNDRRDRHMRDATLLSAAFHDLDRAQPGGAASKERRELLAQALDLLDSVMGELSPRAA